MTNFGEQSKRQKYLIFILALLILVFLFLWWRGFFKVPIGVVTPPIPTPGRLAEIEIDFQILEHPFFKILEPYLLISLPEEKFGRDNPFLPFLQPAEAR